MKTISKKMETLILGLCSVNSSFATPLKDLYKAFMLGELRVFDANTGKQLNPSEYGDCSFESVSFGSRGKKDHYFKTRLRKSQGQESDICRISHLLHRANQLRSELSVINTQLSETYGIAFSDEFLSLHSKHRAFRIPRQGGSTKRCLYSRSGKMTDDRGTVSPTGREGLDSFCLRDVMDQL